MICINKSTLRALTKYKHEYLLHEGKDEELAQVNEQEAGQPEVEEVSGVPMEHLPGVEHQQSVLHLLQGHQLSQVELDSFRSVIYCIVRTIDVRVYVLIRLGTVIFNVNRRLDAFLDL